MRRSAFGLVLLLVLLAGGIRTLTSMERIHGPVAEDLRSSARLAMEGDWTEAEAKLDRAEKAWRKHWKVDAALTDHGPMTEIDCLFARLSVFSELRDAGEFSAGCRELARKVEGLSDSHGVMWWNFL